MISFFTLALFALSVINSSGASSIQAQQVRQLSGFGSARDSLCIKAMCIEAEVEGEVARYILRSTGEEQLGWMALGFGHFMADSAMVIMWPSRDDVDGTYGTVTLSQRKAPFETMPTLDPNPPFIAALEVSRTMVTEEHPQMAFTRPAPPDGMQDIIWAFSRTPPDTAEVDAHISIHHFFGSTMLNLTRTAAPPSEDDAGRPSGGESDSDSDASSGSSDIAGYVHAVLCIAAFLFVIPSGALVVRYAKVTGNLDALILHRNLQFDAAGIGIVGGMLAYLLMDDDGSAFAHKLWGTVLVLLYAVECAMGFWVRRVPARSRTHVHTALLAGLGAIIVLLAFWDAWLGFVAAGHGSLLWCIPIVLIPLVYVIGVVVIHRRYGSMQEDAKGDYVALDTRVPNDDELEDGEGEIPEAPEAAEAMDTKL